MKPIHLVNIGGRYAVNPEEILFLKAETNYTHVYFQDGRRYLSSTTLGLLEKRLCSEFSFFRPNRSFIINLDYINTYESALSTIKMTNDETIILSRRKAKDFRQMW